MANTLSYRVDAYNGYYVDINGDVETEIFERGEATLVGCDIDELFLAGIEFKEVDGEPGLFEGTLYAHADANEQLPVSLWLYTKDYLIKPLFRLDEYDAEQLRQAMAKQDNFPVKFDYDHDTYHIRAW